MTCRVCGGSTEVSGWNGATCVSCASISVVTPPSAERLAECYASYSDYHGGGRRHGARERQKKYAITYLSVVKRFAPDNSTLLDIGSANNPFPNYAAETGYRVTVLDYVRPEGLHSAIAFVQGVAVPTERLRERFEVVTAFAMLEHCSDPKTTSTALASYCRPGGTIVIMTPLVGDFWERHSAAHSCWFFPPEHLHLYSKVGIAKLFLEVGCKMIHFRRFEISRLRWFARYGIAAVEGTAGSILRSVAPQLWCRRRAQKKSISQQMAVYVFTKVVV